MSSEIKISPLPYHQYVPEPADHVDKQAKLIRLFAGGDGGDTSYPTFNNTGGYYNPSMISRGLNSTYMQGKSNQEGDGNVGGNKIGGKFLKSKKYYSNSVCDCGRGCACLLPLEYFYRYGLDILVLIYCGNVLRLLLHQLVLVFFLQLQ